MGEPDEPIGRLQRICDRMLDQVTDEEQESVRVIVLVRDENEGAASTLGYGEESDHIEEVMSDLLGATGMLAESGGIKMSVIPMSGPGPGQG